MRPRLDQNWVTPEFTFFISSRQDTSNSLGYQTESIFGCLRVMIAGDIRNIQYNTGTSNSVQSSSMVSQSCRLRYVRTARIEYQTQKYWFKASYLHKNLWFTGDLTRSSYLRDDESLRQLDRNCTDTKRPWPGGGCILLCPFALLGRQW